MFVNVSHPGQLQNRETRKAIRQHVMRDIGKSRRKRIYPITISIEMPASVSSFDTQNNVVDGHWVPSSTTITKTLQPYGYFAVEPNARARELFHFSKEQDSAIIHRALD